MKITVITEDQIILVDDVPAFMAEIGGFEMRRGEWAVHFDTNKSIGEIEYLDIRNNQTITQADFDSSYAWLLTEHQRYLDHKQAEEQAAFDAAFEQWKINENRPNATKEDYQQWLNSQ